MCKVAGCNSESMYKKQDVCQMHYFRYMRSGTYETTRKRKSRIQNSAGYILVFEPDHFLSQKNGYVYEHRANAFLKYGHSLPDCELCGVPCDWKVYTTHIDHIDEDVTNNHPSNLRPLCNGCNSNRSRPAAIEYKGRYSIEFDGDEKTPAEWSRDPRVMVSGSTIINRKKSGFSDHEALFSIKLTHKS